MLHRASPTAACNKGGERQILHFEYSQGRLHKPGSSGSLIAAASYDLGIKPVLLAFEYGVRICLFLVRSIRQSNRLSFESSGTMWRLASLTLLFRVMLGAAREQG